MSVMKRISAAALRGRYGRGGRRPVPVRIRPKSAGEVPGSSPRYCAWASCPFGQPNGTPLDCCMGLPHPPQSEPTP